MFGRFSTVSTSDCARGGFIHSESSPVVVVASVRVVARQARAASLRSRARYPREANSTVLSILLLFHLFIFLYMYRSRTTYFATLSKGSQQFHDIGDSKTIAYISCQIQIRKCYTLFRCLPWKWLTLVLKVPALWSSVTTPYAQCVGICIIIV